MFSRSVSARKTMIFAVALIVSISAAAAATDGRPFDTCGFQKDTVVEDFKLSILYPMFGQILTTESNDNFYVVSICRPVSKTFYDPKKLAGAIKLTKKGNAVDLGRIDQSNVIVNENSIVLTYIGGDRDRDVEDTCKGLRWTTYLTFLCDPTAIHDVLTLIDEDPDQPEICQVWFEVKTSKICNRQPHLPLAVIKKDFSTLKNQTDHEKYSMRESTNFNLIPSRRNEFDYKTININKNNKFLNIENKEKPNANYENSVLREPTEYSENKDGKLNHEFPEDVSNNDMKYKKTIDNENVGKTSRRNTFENQTSNKEMNDSSDNKKLSDNSKKSNSINDSRTYIIPNTGNRIKYNTVNEGKIVVKEDNQSQSKDDKSIIYDNKVPGDVTKENIANQTHSQNNNSESKSFSKEDRKNEIENHPKNVKSSITESTHRADSTTENKPTGSRDKDVDANTFNTKKHTTNDDTNQTHSQNNYSESKTFQKEDRKNEIENHLKNVKSSITESTHRADSTTENKPTGSRDKDVDANTFNTKKHTTNDDTNQMHSQNNYSEFKTFQKEDRKDEIENHPKNVKSSITESTHRADSTTENKPTDSRDKDVDANTFNTKKHTTNDDTNQMHSQNNYSEFKTFQKEDRKDEIENHPKNVKSSITESTHRADSTTENKPTGSRDKDVDANTFNTKKHTTNDDTNQMHSQNNYSESKTFQKEDRKNEIENHLKNVKSSITESTHRADSTTENKPTGSRDKDVDANTFNTKKHTTNDDTNQMHSQNNYSESKTFQKEDRKNEIENHPKNVKSSITESTHRADSTTENKPTDSRDKDVDANIIYMPKPNTNNYGNPTIDVHENNRLKNNNTSGNDDNIIAVTIKPTKTNPSNTMVNDNTNESGEVNGSSTESPVDGSLNNIKTNNKSEPNGTIINETNNVKKNLQPNQSKPVPSAHSSDNEESDNSKTTTDNTNQSGNGFSFDNLFSKIFPNGIHVSATTIIGALASLTAVTGVVGTAINRYYYKQTGTDQIPFKGTIKSIFNWIKGIIMSFCCCCCRRGGYDDLEAPNLTNEKTPLLQPKFNIPTPLVVDETSQKSSDSGDNADSSKQNSSNEYGSMSKEKKSSTTEKKYRKIKRKSKTSDTSNSTPESLVKNVEEKLINVENNLQGKSIKEVISGKINTIFTEKLKPTFDSIVEKVGKKVESTDDEIKKDLDKISKDAALISKFLENEKSTKVTDDVRVDVEIKSEKPNLNENETQNAVVQEDIKSITLGESQQSPNVKPLSEVIVSQVSVPDLQQIERNEQPSDMKTSTADRVATEELTKSTHNKKDIDIKNNIENILETVVTSPTDTKTSINESKLKFLGFEKEDKNVQKVVTGDSIATDKKIENEEDDVEVIEEIIYIDGEDGEEDEEIIEEIIETTVTEDSPDTLDESIPGSGKTKVTVRTTRKISSSSLPGEVKTFEETVVTDGIPENKEKQSGFQFGVGKSGMSMSVGDKKMGIGKSGLNITRNKSKSPKNVEGDEADKRDTKSPEKSKKSMSMPKIFKRSISQPTDDDIQEAEDESTKKLSRTGSGLFKSGKSRSKPTLVLKTGDVTMDADAMSNFMDNERNASRISNAGLGELNLTVGDEGVAATVAVRKTSTTTSKEKDTPVTTETVNISPVDLGFGLGRDRQSTQNAETKSNAKTKREKKDKTKLTSLSRPF